MSAVELLPLTTATAGLGGGCVKTWVRNDFGEWSSPSLSRSITNPELPGDAYRHLSKNGGSGSMAFCSPFSGLRFHTASVEGGCRMVTDGARLSRRRR